MIFHLYRDAFSEVYTYRHRLTDEDDQLLFQAIWPPMGASLQPEQIALEDAQEVRRAQLAWEERGWWLGDRFHLTLEGEPEPIALVEELWHIVDRLLLHLPRYRFTLRNGNRLELHGSRYGGRIYEIYALPAIDETSDQAGEATWVGEIAHPAAGPTYIFRTDSPLLTAMPLLLLAAGVIVDLWGLKRDA